MISLGVLLTFIVIFLAFFFFAVTDVFEDRITTPVVGIMMFLIPIAAIATVWEFILA